MEVDVEVRSSGIDLLFGVCGSENDSREVFEGFYTDESKSQKTESNTEAD